MARDDRQRRRGGREVAQHPKGNRSRRPRSWHRGAGEAWRWLAAVGRVDAARMCEQFEDWPQVGDAVMVAVPAHGQTVRKQRTEGGR